MVHLEIMIFNLTQSMSLLCIFLFSIFILCFTINRRNFSNRPPSPPKLPFIGNLHQISSIPHHSLYSLSQKFGPLMLLHFAQVPWLIVSSSDMACAVMRTHDLIFATRPSAVISEILRFRDMAFEPYGEDWRQLKKIFTLYLMNTKKIASYSTIREKQVGNLIAKISNHASISSGNPIDLSKLLFSFMIDVICSVVSGKFIMEECRYAMIREVVEENFNLMGRFAIGDLFPSLSWLDGVVGLSRRAHRNRKKWDLLFEELIQAHESRENNEGQDNFVDILLSLKNDATFNFDFSMDQMKGLLADAFAAGIDTTYITIDWAMSELIKNPNLMKKLQEEVRGIVKHGDMVRSEDLNQMSYLKVVIKETLRLHPPIPLLLPREAMEECEINGFTIPKGTRVLINAWAIAREGKSWDEVPEKFMPERFIGRQVDYKGNDFQFIPFGAGRRMCPGLLFGTATAELALANLIHRFDWELPNGMTREEFNMGDSPGFSVHRKDDLKLVVKDVHT